jgi:thiamine-monophosphate kinase
MNPLDLKERLRFYFITDDASPGFAAAKQAETAVAAGATAVQYRNKSFSLKDFEAAEKIANLCRTHGVLFIVNDDILLARALRADGVHLGQTDAAPSLAGQVLGPDAVIGRSVSTPAELASTDLSGCSYIGCGPVFSTGTKADAKPAIGLPGLKAVADQSVLPVVAIGGIDAARIKDCLACGAIGAAVISNITRSKNPAQSALDFGKACGCQPRKILKPWHDEFALIDRMLGLYDDPKGPGSILRIPAGDDAALLASLRNPVVTTDTQRENIHFRFDWMTADQLGEKAVEITFSDLAACYAVPKAVFVNLSIPFHTPAETVESVCRGINAALNRHQAVLGGGNVSSGVEFAVDLFAVGEGRPDLFPLRSAARPGDGLYVTGPLGLARAGLECLLARDTRFPGLIEKFKAPRARFDAADILAQNKVACVMDLSDGLCGDAAHIAAASRVSIRLTPESFVTDLQLAAYCREHGQQPERMILSGGEDYELLFACGPEKFEAIKADLPQSFRVGICIPSEGKAIVNLPEGVSSYQHGKRRGA